MAEVGAPPSAIWRHVLTGFTILVLLGVLGVGGYVGYKTLFAPLPGHGRGHSGKGSGCVAGVHKGQSVHTRDITVSVFNAGTRSGLAGQTLEQLTARGFIPGDVGNAPETQRVLFVRVLAPKVTNPAARLVALQFGRRTPILHGRADLGPGVDVIVGDRFVGLARQAPRKIKAVTSGSGC